MDYSVEIDENCEDGKDYHFTTFYDSFKTVSRCLTVGCMYPNPATVKKRLAYILVLMAVTNPLCVFVAIEIVQHMIQMDIVTVTRHTIIGGPYLLALLKKLLSFIKRDQTKELIDEMDRDLASYNRLPRRYKMAAARSMRRSRFYFERVWPLCIMYLNVVYLGIPMGSTIYSQIFDETPTRYMIHEVGIPFTEYEVRLQTPYYEIMLAVQLLVEAVIMVNYMAYDGHFGILTNHTCLKMQIYCMYLEDAFKQEDPEEMDKGIRLFLEEQKRCMRYKSVVQDVFNVWLGVILIGMMMQIGSLLYNIAMGGEFDFRNAMYSILCVIHTYLPCMTAASLKDTSKETATMIYSSGWEDVRSKRVRRIIPLLIARAQEAEQLTVLQLFTYDMELFVMIMRTAYTMFTLLQTS